MNWDDLRYFLAIARSNSLTAAAKELGVSQPTVSRRLAAMEQSLGVTLFERTKVGYEPSAVGIEILQTAEHVEEEFNDIDRKVFGRDQRLVGSLRITCTETLANLYLARQLGEFVREHPGIDISLVCTFQQMSLSRREADIAIRTTYQPPDTLIGRMVANAAFGVYCATADLTSIRESSEAKQWNWIGWQDETYNRMLITSRFPGARIKHRVDDMQTMQSMARHGLGVIVIPCHMADPDPGLARVVPEPMIEDTPDLWILFHPDVKHVARVRLFTEFLTERFLADRDLFEGRYHRSN